jgi:hypothetical protein
MAPTTERDVARRTDLAVKIDASLARKAKIVASYKDMSLAQYLSEALRPIVENDLREQARRTLNPDDKDPKRPKGPKS